MAAEHLDLSTLILPIFNFTVFAVALTIIYRKKVAPFLRARTAEFTANMSRVAELEAKIDREISSLRTQVQELEESEGEVIQAFREEGIRSGEAIAKQVSDEIRHSEQETAQLKDNLLNQLEGDIRGEILDLAMRRARERLSVTLTGDLDKNLRRDVLRSFQS